jgi:hypothetical protein
MYEDRIMKPILKIVQNNGIERKRRWDKNSKNGVNMIKICNMAV